MFIEVPKPEGSISVRRSMFPIACQQNCIINRDRLRRQKHMDLLPEVGLFYRHRCYKHGPPSGSHSTICVGGICKKCLVSLLVLGWKLTGGIWRGVDSRLLSHMQSGGTFKLVRTGPHCARL